MALCGEVQKLSNKLGDLCARGLGDSPEAKEITRLQINILTHDRIDLTIFLLFYIIFRNLSDKLCELKNAIEKAVVNRVVEDFIDIGTPLKQFSEAVNVPEGKLFKNVFHCP